MLTNPCFYVFGDAFRVLHFYCTPFLDVLISRNKEGFTTTVYHKPHLVEFTPILIVL